MFKIPEEPEKSTLKMPGGGTAGNINRIQLLLVWAKEYEKRGRKVKYLGVGHPSAAINPTVCSTSLDYWQQLKQGAKEINTNLDKLNQLSHKQIFHMCTEQRDVSQEFQLLIDNLEETNTYDDNALKERTAGGFNKFYTLYPVTNTIAEKKIKAENILPTQGGGGGLYNLFKYLSKETPESYLALKLPYYTLYNVGPQGKSNKLLFFDVIKRPQYPTVSQVSKISLEELNECGKPISAIVVCNPDNPTGKVFSENEWETIVEARRKNNCLLIVDEAYAEVNFSEKLLVLEFVYKKLDYINNELSGEEQKTQKVIYEEFLNSLVILRSGTKGLSGPGQRMAAMIVFFEPLMHKLIKENAYMGFPPRSSQVAYAESVGMFNSRFMDSELNFLSYFYEEQVRYIENKLRELGIAYIEPYDNYNEVEGTFYVRANFNSLIGLKIEDKKIQLKLQEIGLNGEKLITDEDIAYYLLITKGIMLTYLSPWGENPKNGTLRITCSGGKALFDEVFDDIKEILTMAEKQNSPSLPFSPLLTIKQEKMSESLPKHLSLSNLRIESQNVRESFLSPHEKFIEWIESYWKTYCLKSEKAEKIRKDHTETTINNLKAFLKVHFTDATNTLLNKHLTLPLPEISKEGLFILTEKLQAILDIIQLVCAYLRKKCKKKKIALSYCAHIIEIFSPSFEIASQTSFDEDTTKSLDTLVENYCNHQDTTNEYLLATRQRNLISDLVFEKIFYETIIEGKENPFSEIFSKNYLSKKNEIDNKFSLIEQIVAEHATIDYTHPKGDEDKRKIMAEALNLWYGDEIINSDDMLFVSIESTALLNNVFERNIFPLNMDITSITRQQTKKINKWEANITSNYTNVLGQALDENQLQETSEKIIKYLTSNTNNFIIIDESYIERCLDETMSLGKKSLLTILLKNSEFKDRIILIRSAMGIFSPSKEKISVIVTFNKAIMARLLDESINMHVHAPQSLQHGYAHAMNEFVKNMFTKPEYRHECVQYINRLCKYYLTRILIARKKQECMLSNSPKHLSIEENNEKKNKRRPHLHFMFPSPPIIFSRENGINSPDVLSEKNRTPSPFLMITQFTKTPPMQLTLLDTTEKGKHKIPPSQTD